MDVERLIECVRKHIFLYDLSHSEYKNIFLKAAVWESIGKELNENSEAVKNKWKTLRDGYRKYKRQVKGTTGSSRKNIIYSWSSQLSFLDNVNAPRTPASNIAIEVTPPPPRIQTPIQYSEYSQDLLPPPSNPSTLPTTPTPPQVPPPELPANVPSTSIASSHPVGPTRSTKRNESNDVEKVLNFLSKKKKNQYDGVDHLFLSYADTFKKFPPREQALLKLELAKLFTNTELRFLENSENSPSQYTSTSSPAYSNISSLDNTIFQEINTPPHQPVNLSHCNTNLPVDLQFLTNTNNNTFQAEQTNLQGNLLLDEYEGTNQQCSIDYNYKQ